MIWLPYCLSMPSERRIRVVDAWQIRIAAPRATLSRLRKIGGKSRDGADP
jgi:hypothetical protein